MTVRDADYADTYVSRWSRRGKQKIVRHRPGNRTFAKIAIAFAAFHIGMTLLYLVSAPVGPLRPLVVGYMEPVFKQSWYVFAPDPVSRNAYLEVRAKKTDGTVTDWFNISSCDVNSAVLHHPIPNRRYLTTFQLVRHFEIQRDNLPKPAQDALTRDRSGSNWTTQIAEELRADKTPEKNIKTFSANAMSTHNFVSSVARARWGEVTDVQMRIRSVYTRPFEQRNTNVPLKTQTWQGGYLPAAPADPGIDLYLADLYAPKAGC